MIINLKHILVNANKFNSLNLRSALTSAMEAPPLKGEIGSLEALTAKGVPRDLTPEFDVDLLDAAMVDPLKNSSSYGLVLTSILRLSGLQSLQRN